MTALIIIQLLKGDGVEAVSSFLFSDPDGSGARGSTNHLYHSGKNGRADARNVGYLHGLHNHQLVSFRRVVPSEPKFD